MARVVTARLPARITPNLKPFRVPESSQSEVPAVSGELVVTPELAYGSSGKSGAHGFTARQLARIDEALTLYFSSRSLLDKICQQLPSAKFHLLMFNNVQHRSPLYTLKLTPGELFGIAR